MLETSCDDDPDKDLLDDYVGEVATSFRQSKGSEALTRGKVATVVEPDDAVRVLTHPIYNN